MEWFRAKEDGSSKKNSKVRVVAKINNGGSTNQNGGNNKIEVVPEGSNNNKIKSRVVAKIEDGGSKL